MTTIQDTLKNILLKQQEIGYRMLDWLQPPATLDTIQVCEQRVGFLLNEELRDFYLHSNGVILNEDSFDEYLLPTMRMLSIEEAVEYRLHLNEILETLDYPTDDFRPGTKLFPFLTDESGNHYWVDLNENIPENYGKIYWTNSWGDPDDYKYTSLSSMLKIVHDAYQQNIFGLDTDNWLTCDFQKYRLLAEKNEPMIAYWTRPN